jgi:hypothetical protein
MAESQALNMTNLERWRAYTRDLVSPDSFVNMGFYYLIGACLQRRIWYGPDQDMLFPNVYFILVGEPGVGKGLILGKINYFLKFFQKKDRNLTPEELEVLIITGRRPLNDGQREISEAEMGGTTINGKVKLIDPPLLFPVGADDTTYQALTQSLADSNRSIDLPANIFLAPTGKYVYKSVAFCIEELSSLFNKDAERVANFLLCAFDCKDYRYETKSQGKDILRKPCLSFIGGTTPAFMQKAFSSTMLNDGFCARSVFVYEFSNRHHKFKIEDLDIEQLEARAQILRHIHALSKLVGRVTLTEEAEAFCRDYFEVQLPSGKVRVNKSQKLNNYYGRKKVHTIKMAMLVHFADKLDMVITLEEVKKALSILDEIESRMHYALTFGANPLAGVQKELMKFLSEKAKMSNDPMVIGMTFEELWIQFVTDVREAELKEVLSFCLTTGLVKTVPHPKTNKDLYVFSAKA